MRRAQRYGDSHVLLPVPISVLSHRNPKALPSCLASLFAP